MVRTHLSVVRPQTCVGGHSANEDLGPASLVPARPTATGTGRAARRLSHWPRQTFLSGNGMKRGRRLGISTIMSSAVFPFHPSSTYIGKEKRADLVQLSTQAIYCITTILITSLPSITTILITSLLSITIILITSPATSRSLDIGNGDVSSRPL